jgi:phage-related protein
VLILVHLLCWRYSIKKIIWNLRAREFVRALDVKTKVEIGSLLMLLQLGENLSEPQSKPIKSIHMKAHELRVKDRRGIYRVIYVLATEDSIFIPHAFTKKTQKTLQREIELSIKRLKEMLHEN